MKKAKLYFDHENCSGPLGTMAQGTKEREEDCIQTVTST